MAHRDLTGLISDVVVTLPAEEVQRSPGLALDIGSTVGKIIYRSNKEYKNGLPITPQNDSTKGQVHFAMFPRGDTKGLINYIKDNCDLVSNGDDPVIVNSAGVGGAAFRTEIETGLNCKMKIIPEFDSFCKAFLAVEKVTPEEELFDHISPETEKQLKAMADARAASFRNMMGKWLPRKMEDQVATKIHIPQKPETEESKDEDPPRLLVMAGSGTGIFQVNSDGTFSMIDTLYAGGRFMHGLASILGEQNDFKKLLEMAEDSDGKTVDTWLSELLVDPNAAGPKDSIYEMSVREGDRNWFPFGKGVHVPPEKMKKGDLVWSVFNTAAHINAHTIGLNVKLTKAKHVYIVGNVFNSDLMRTMISKVKLQMVGQGSEYEYHFVKNGGMYGALGAFLEKQNDQ